MSEDHVTRAISVAIRQVLERYRSVDYDIKINALIANLTDIVAREEHLTERETYARITAHFAKGPLETPEKPETPVTAKSQLNATSQRGVAPALQVHRANQMAGKRAGYVRRQQLVAHRAALKKREEGES